MKGSLKFDLSQVSTEELKEELVKRKENKKQEILNKLVGIMEEAAEYGIKIVSNCDSYVISKFETLNDDICYFEKDYLD